MMLWALRRSPTTFWVVVTMPWMHWRGKPQVSLSHHQCSSFHFVSTATTFTCCLRLDSVCQTLHGVNNNNPRKRRLYLDDVVSHWTDEAAIFPRRLLPFAPLLLGFFQDAADERGQFFLQAGVKAECFKGANRRKKQTEALLKGLPVACSGIAPPGGPAAPQAAASPSHRC